MALRRATSKRNGLRKLRHIALHAQGFGRKAPFGRGLNATEKAIAHLGYVQIDTISVVERAHHHVLHSRVPNYSPEFLTQLLKSRKIFEYWSHAAAFLPIEDFRYSLPFKKRFRTGEFSRSKNTKLMKQIVTRITAEGPLMARDFEDRKTTSTGWWDWKPAKQALEQLFMQGDLMIDNRQGFQKRYDLTERVLPSQIPTSYPTMEEFANHVITSTLRANGFANLKFFTYLRRNKELRVAVKKQLLELCANDALIELTLPNNDTVFIDPELWESRTPTIQQEVKFLSPFDNLVIQRDRIISLFSFDYQIECYVPAVKRKFGYFCLPILMGDRFMGRIDIKAHRKRGELEILALHFDTPEWKNHQRSINAAVESFAEFNRCQTVCWSSQPHLAER